MESATISSATTFVRTNSLAGALVHVSDVTVVVTVMFHVSSYKSSEVARGKEFVAAIGQALDDMKALLLSANS